MFKAELPLSTAPIWFLSPLLLWCTADFNMWILLHKWINECNTFPSGKILNVCVCLLQMRQQERDKQGQWELIAVQKQLTVTAGGLYLAKTDWSEPADAVSNFMISQRKSHHHNVCGTHQRWRCPPSQRCNAPSRAVDSGSTWESSPQPCCWRTSGR